MHERNLTYLIVACGFVLILAGLLSCTGKQAVQSDDEPESSGGRAVTPDADWGLTGPDKHDGENGDDEVDTDEDSDEAPTDALRVEANVEFQLLVNGQPHPIEEPIEAHEGEQVEITFHLVATGSELAQYAIRNDARVSIPRSGELSGYQADVPYRFTYNSQLWGEGGIVITVTNKQGDTFMTNVTVAPASGQPGG